MEGFLSRVLFGEQVDVSREEMDGLPVLRLAPRGARGSLPVVVHFHGWSSSKEAQLLLGQCIALLGAQVILPDAWLHGENGALADYQSMGRLWEVVQETTARAKPLLTALVREAGPVFLSGSSMGGFIAGKLFSEITAVRGLVCIKSTLAWRRLCELAQGNGVRFETLPADEPLERPERFFDGRPVMMVNCENDPVIPISTVDDSLAALAAFGQGRASGVRAVRFRNGEHTTTISMLEETLAFFRAQLPAGVGA